MPGQNDPGLAMAQSFMSEDLKKIYAPATYREVMVIQQAAAQTPMPAYVSHKKVWALKIEKVHVDEQGHGVALVFENRQFGLRAFTADQLKNRPNPEAGMYMVQYEDGYISFSPGKAFEDGYTLLSPRTRPTIAELETLLNSEKDEVITINPDGSVTA